MKVFKIFIHKKKKNQAGIKGNGKESAGSETNSYNEQDLAEKDALNQEETLM